MRVIWLYKKSKNKNIRWSWIYLIQSYYEIIHDIDIVMSNRPHS